MDDTSVDARSRLNDRFKLPANLKSRLGHKEYEEQQQQYYDSGDSLERDTGADLGKLIKGLGAVHKLLYVFFTAF